MLSSSSATRVDLGLLLIDGTVGVGRRQRPEEDGQHDERAGHPLSAAGRRTGGAHVDGNLAKHYEQISMLVSFLSRSGR